MDVINKQTMSMQIYHILRNDILTQKIKCGSKLTLQSLKERFEVSHTPIREALTRLVEDNLVTYYSNVGVSVVSLNANDAREIFELNGDLDCIALKYSYYGSMKDEFLKELGEAVTEGRLCIAEKRLNRWQELSDQFHLILYKYANNSRLEYAARKLRAQTTLLYNLYYLEDQNAEVTQEFHNRIYQAISEDDIPLASQLLKEHLQNDIELAVKALGQ
ncbi:GntR family transcriptional regulator [Sedimentibacter sp.]|uniref:GntR family transcriptional regulator n=1 Tax=Sedimentibacter sp. TaxID=1960295 RepID=UPI0028AD1A54|nr:GntR family transcriptional regulator [Sedimentibacter sp.]